MHMAFALFKGLTVEEIKDLAKRCQITRDLTREYCRSSWYHGPEDLPNGTYEETVANHRKYARDATRRLGDSTLYLWLFAKHSCLYSPIPLCVRFLAVATKSALTELQN